jgi:hypothetical protein
LQDQKFERRARAYRPEKSAEPILRPAALGKRGAVRQWHRGASSSPRPASHPGITAAVSGANIAWTLPALVVGASRARPRSLLPLGNSMVEVGATAVKRLPIGRDRQGSGLLLSGDRRVQYARKFVMTLTVAGVVLPIVLAFVTMLIKVIRAVHEDTRKDQEVQDYLDSLDAAAAAAPNR